MLDSRTQFSCAMCASAKCRRQHLDRHVKARANEWNANVWMWIWEGWARFNQVCVCTRVCVCLCDANLLKIDNTVLYLLRHTHKHTHAIPTLSPRHSLCSVKQLARAIHTQGYVSYRSTPAHTPWQCYYYRFALWSEQRFYPHRITHPPSNGCNFCFLVCLYARRGMRHWHVLSKPHCRWQTNWKQRSPAQSCWK